MGATTLICALLVLGWLGSAAWWGDTACEISRGSSLYGQASVSWLPPGRTCTYTDVLPGETHVDSPDWSRLVVLGIAIVGLPATLYTRRALYRATSEAHA